MTRPLEVVNVVGARPNFMKIAPIQRAMNRHLRDLHWRLVHTGQHYDANMSEVFFHDLGLRSPDHFLGVGSGGHGEQTGRIMIEFEKIMLARRPDLVIVAGDVNSTIACALVAVKLHIPVAHVEAGCRSHDRTMPEEINRILTDAISDLLFTIDDISGENLKREGATADRIHLVGDTMVDSLDFALEKVKDDAEILRRFDIKPRRFCVATLHRPANVDRLENWERIERIIGAVAADMPVILPVHPRTRRVIETHPELAARLQAMANLRLIEPLGYFKFVALFSQAALVVTDSGSLQQETTHLNIPCITLRDNTERPITTTDGSNVLVGLSTEAFLREYARFSGDVFPRARPIPLWDGHAAERIVDVILQRRAKLLARTFY